MSLQQLILNVQLKLSRPKALDIIFDYIAEKMAGDNISELNEELSELTIHYCETYMLIGVLTATFLHKEYLPARQKLVNNIQELLINVRMRPKKDLEGLQ